LDAEVLNLEKILSIRRARNKSEDGTLRGGHDLSRDGLYHLLESGHSLGGGYAIPGARHYSLFVSAGGSLPAGDYHVYPITAGALIVVGYFMMNIVRGIQWQSFEETFPAFLIIVGILLTYNISYGIGFGFISCTVMKIINGKYRDVPPLLYGISAAFLLAFVLPFL
jgi:hypothetical protein